MVLDKLLSNLSVQVKPFAICSISPGWRLCLPGPPGLLLHFVLKGDGVLSAADEARHPLSSLHASIVPTGTFHVIENGDEISSELRLDKLPEGEPVFEITAGEEDEGSLVIGCGIIDVRYGNSFGLFDQLSRILSADLTNTPQALAAFRGMLDEQNQAVSGYDAMTAALMTQCLVHFFRGLPHQGLDTMPWLIALQDDRLARVVSEVIDNPGADHSVDSMAETAAMSRSAFSSLFAKFSGYSPMRFVNHIRMQQAADLLANQSATIDEIAHSVGYASRSHFSRAFKEQMGQSPQSFRLSH